MLVWQADKDVHSLVEKIQQKHHSPRLDEANIAVSLNDGKAFIKNRFNWGKTQKFSNVAKLWHSKDKRYDFLVNISSDAWYEILNEEQRSAWLDLHLTRCQVEFEPEVIEENGVKRPEKDEWGRTRYTEVIRRDEEGEPRWLVVPLDLNVFQDNVIRYGCWCADLLNLRSAIEENKKKCSTSTKS